AKHPPPQAALSPAGPDAVLLTDVYLHGANVIGLQGERRRLRDELQVSCQAAALDPLGYFGEDDFEEAGSVEVESGRNTPVLPLGTRPAERDCQAAVFD